MTTLSDDIAAHPEALVDVLTRRAHTDPGALLVRFRGQCNVTVGEWWARAESSARALLAPPTGLRPRLQAAGVPAAVVGTGEELVDRDPQLAARRFNPIQDHPLAGPVWHEGEGVVARRAGTVAPFQRPAPLLGQHTDEVLTELLGLEQDDINALTDNGVLQ